MLSIVSNTTPGPQNHLSFITNKAAVQIALSKPFTSLAHAPANSIRTGNSFFRRRSGESDSVTVL